MNRGLVVDLFRVGGGGASLGIAPPDLARGLEKFRATVGELEAAGYRVDWNVPAPPHGPLAWPSPDCRPSARHQRRS